MNIFNQQDYKQIAANRLASYPNKGRGQLLRIAEKLHVPPSTLSSVFSGSRDLTFEQASELADYFGFSPLEAEYFVTLVEKARAGNQSLKRLVEKRLERLQRESNQIKTRITHNLTLSENEKFVFYSEWFYSAIRLLTSVEGFQTAPRIAEALALPIQRVHEILHFLQTHGLCVEKGGEFRMGPSSTLVSGDDPLVYRHHRNWRELAIGKLGRSPKLNAGEFCVTVPCSTSRKAMERMKRALVDCLTEITHEIDTSKEELVAYLNIDLFELET